MKEWCNACDMERADYLALYRDDTGIAKWSSPNGTEWAQVLCLDCLYELHTRNLLGQVWQFRYRSLIGNVWNTTLPERESA